MMRVSNDARATGQGIIHSVDAQKNMVNLSHGPIPSLSWPEMTMDLPVADGVDISGLKPDDEVRFRVVLGADQVYRITSIDVLR
jgi:Cu/Ag efflux protein CusF